MTTIRQYRPNFIDLDEPLATVTVETIADFDAIPWLARWGESPSFKMYGFWPNGSDPGGKIMAVLDDGAHWWVIGFADGPIHGLPEWTAAGEQAKRAS